MNPTVSIQGGPRPRSSGTVSSRAMMITTPTAAITDASTMRSMPSTSTTSEAETRK